MTVPNETSPFAHSTSPAPESPGSSAFAVLGFIVALAVGFFAVRACRNEAPQIASQDVGPRIVVDIHGDEPKIGRDDALVTIIVFSDYECGFCARAEAPLHAAQQAFASDVRILYKHMPMPRHDAALPAARIAWAAHRQGRFFDLHPLLFDAQGRIADMMDAAERIGLDMERLQKDLLSEEAAAAISADFFAGSRAGVTGTPTFFVNGHRYVGTRQRQEWIDVLEVELADAQQTAERGGGNGGNDG